MDDILLNAGKNASSSVTSNPVRDNNCVGFFESCRIYFMITFHFSMSQMYVKERFI
ncbi:hypothetical protein Barb6XT_01314 [Bacteroidales bacterium Barb6XT]|nr:hypothetical protein Barb6XT_01314 [Bacteroidales bacterium Barb6XT]